MSEGGGLRFGRRAAPSASTPSSSASPDRSLPLLVEAERQGVDLVEHARAGRDEIRANVLRHGGVLFRGFGVSTDSFADFVRAVSGEPLDYVERSSPRHEVSGRIYTSTDHPSSQHIFLHNEQSYNVTWPLRILFHCAVAAATGGETPIADTRRIYDRIPREIRDEFTRRGGYTYVRNFQPGLGLTWQEAFRTSARDEVAAYCSANDIRPEWLPGDRLRTTQVRPVIVAHPETGAPLWFNHATFFHVSTLEPRVREALLAVMPEDEVPNNTYYGDGGSIDSDVLDVLRGAYEEEAVAFPWRPGDVLLLDNMLVAHGRRPYTGDRKVLAAMSEPHRARVPDGAVTSSRGDVS
jgi:alpha-ketoglutarate-dependent taurine dioxygenase